jgi:hypothetical protein
MLVIPVPLLIPGQRQIFPEVRLESLSPLQVGLQRCPTKLLGRFRADTVEEEFMTTCC